MKRNPVMTLVTLSKNMEEGALRRLSTLLRQCGSDEERLALLRQYHREYAHRLSVQERSGMPAPSKENFMRFMTSLDGAVAQQESHADRSRSAVDEGRQALNDARRRTRIFETLVQRREDVARRREARRQQQIDDEFASRRFSNQKT